ncbi:MAG: hypothetical protein E7181_04385 [Erysipelotrichaceae bacterium]|nr:hypothetical protein [Erysipelotrichaceae bacterium]
MTHYEYAVIGMGPGGIQIALNLFKAGKNVVIIEKSTPGGKVNIAPRIDNYPGYPKINGPDLAFVLFDRINEAEVPSIYDEVKEVKKVDDKFILTLLGDTISADKVIVASGTLEKKIGLKDEDRFFGHGLSYCAICDGHFFKDQINMVIAQDKYAISEAIYLTSLAKEVIVVTSFETLKGDKRNLDELASKDNVKYIYNRKVVELNGVNALESVTLDDGTVLPVKGLFPLMGYIPNSQFLPKEILNDDGFVITDKNFETSIPGLYAIGDIMERELKQIYLAESDANRLTKVLLG